MLGPLDGVLLGLWERTCEASLARFRRELARYRAEESDWTTDATAPLDPGVAAQLRELGYVD